MPSTRWVLFVGSAVRLQSRENVTGRVCLSAAAPTGSTRRWLESTRRWYPAKRRPANPRMASHSATESLFPCSSLECLKSRSKCRKPPARCPNGISNSEQSPPHQAPGRGAHCPECGERLQCDFLSEALGALCRDRLVRSLGDCVHERFPCVCSCASARLS